MTHDKNHGTCLRYMTIQEAINANCMHVEQIAHICSQTEAKASKLLANALPCATMHALYQFVIPMVHDMKKAVISDDFTTAYSEPSFNSTFTTVLTDSSPLALAKATMLLFHSKTIDTAPQTIDNVPDIAADSNDTSDSQRIAPRSSATSSPASPIAAQPSNIDLMQPRIRRRDTTSHHASSIDVDVSKKRHVQTAKVPQTYYDVGTTAYEDAKARANKAHAIFHVEGNRLEKATQVLSDFSFKPGDSHYVDALQGAPQPLRRHPDPGSKGGVFVYRSFNSRHSLNGR